MSEKTTEELVGNPIVKCPNGKYKIGEGKCMYDSKKKALEVQRAIYAQKNK